MWRRMGWITGGSVLLGTALVLATCSFAAVPAPPVNQTIGTADTVFDELDKDNCLACHIDLGEHAGQESCLSCHLPSSGEPTPHHAAVDLADPDCVGCHGDLVANTNDGHEIPSYDTSMVTPKSSGGEGELGRGGCDYCHLFGYDAASETNVVEARYTHHDTGLGQDFSSCSLCHDWEAEEEQDIRICERCHSVTAIHNIQADSNGDGWILPGEELAGYGHIGNNDDCLGCHENYLPEEYAGIFTGGGGRGQGNLQDVGNPTRHHMLAAVRGIGCLDCHELELNDQDQFVFTDFRWCGGCHSQRHGGRN